MKRIMSCHHISMAQQDIDNAGEAQKDKISTLSIFAMRPVGGSQVHICPYLISAISADCRTRPQYVERSYCEAGRSRFPGNEADISIV